MNIIKYLTNRKYRLFMKKIADVEVAMWEIDFKIAKSREVREGVRLDRDKALEERGRLEGILKTELPAEEKKKREEEKVAVDGLIGKYEGQMKMIDEQISGIPAQGENPGQQGLMDALSSLAELKSMYKSYARRI